MPENAIHDMGELKWWGIRPSTEELREILNDHKEWLENGAEGDPPHNLSGVDLNLDPIADTSEAISCQHVLDRADLRKANLSYAMLQGVDFSRANLQGANFFKANLATTNFESADLRDASLCAVILSGTNFRGANLESVDLSLANASHRGEHKLSSNLFEDSNLTNASLEHAVLLESSFEGADLRLSNLKRANFMGSDMRGAKFYDANACDANFQETNGLLSHQFARAMLEGAILPETAARFETIDAALRSIQHARKAHTAAIVLGIYMCWQAWNCALGDKIGINTLGLVTDPIQFARISDCLFTVLNLIFLFYLGRIWTSYNTMPAVFPHGDSIAIYPSPWINMTYCSFHVFFVRERNPVEVIITHFVNWWIFPAIMLVVTIGYARLENVSISTINVITFLTTFWFSITAYFVAKSNFSRSYTLSEKQYLIFVAGTLISLVVAIALFNIWPNWLNSLLASPSVPPQHYPGSI